MDEFDQVNFVKIAKVKTGHNVHKMRKKVKYNKEAVPFLSYITTFNYFFALYDVIHKS